jgi:hypothetical protein
MTLYSSSISSTSRFDWVLPRPDFERFSNTRLNRREHAKILTDISYEILIFGGMESIVPAMQNRVQGGILSYLAIGRAKKLGFHELLEIASLNFS